MKTSVVLALLLFAAVSFAQETSCNNGNLQNCQQCVNANITNGDTCGWCAATQMCINGTKAGPSDGTVCLGGAWSFGPNGCVQCSALSSCDQCTQHNADCFWCTTYSNNTSCRPLASHLGCRTSESVCACHKYGTCSQCTGSDHCQWCPTTGECLELSDNNCTGGAQALTCPCSEYVNCFECRTDDTCSWCSDSGTCNNKTNLPTGCLVAHNCNQYCAQGADCRSCSQLNGCSWCYNFGSTQCIDTTTQAVPNCQIAHYCEDPSVCQYIDDCSSCNHVPGCGWCDATGTCGDASDGSCAYLHFCPANPPSTTGGGSHGGFDAASFVGGMFLIIGVAVIGVAGFAFYRWKIAKASYTELK